MVELAGLTRGPQPTCWKKSVEYTMLKYTQKGSWPRSDGKLAELQTYSLFSIDDLPDWEVVWSA